MQKSFAWIVTTDFFSQPPSYLTHSSPGLRQSLEINGIFARAKKHKTETQLKATSSVQFRFHFQADCAVKHY